MTVLIAGVTAKYFIALFAQKHNIYKIYVLKVAIGLNHVNCRIKAQELHSFVDF